MAKSGADSATRIPDCASLHPGYEPGAPDRQRCEVLDARFRGHDGFRRIVDASPSRHPHQNEQVVLLITAAGAAAHESGGAGDMRSPHINRRLIMNVNEARDVRELSADELETVNGGIFPLLMVAAGVWGGFGAMVIIGESGPRLEGASCPI
jgi:lactobin A/cerein 7B family class IIb bacteriocin